jgi:ubiquinone/menaquinone biosynthesis C-methylase UbiE
MTLPAYAAGRASFPQLYEQLLVQPLFRPFVDDLFERVALKPFDRVLDVACGTGIVARCAKERLGPQSVVVGVDVSPPMIAVASERGPTVDWRVGSADALPIVDSQRFDVVLCQQGLQFFPDKPAALREMRRVLAPAGRVAISCWRSATETPMYRELQRVAERHLGPVHDQRMSFGDESALVRLLASAGFNDVAVGTVERTIRFDDAAMWVHMNATALIGMSKIGAQLDDEARARLLAVIERESEPVLEPFKDGDGVTFTAATNVGTAHLPPS